MALSWNEIKIKAVAFSKKFEHTIRERAEAQTFLNDFFDVFGISRKKVGTFEYRVNKLNDSNGYIDLLWKGTILIEMKSFGENLDDAFQQAKDYTYGLKSFELPKYIMVSDFIIFRLYDTEEQTTIEFTLPEFINNVQHFGFIAGYQKRVFKEEDPVNIHAAELMGKIHDKLKDIRYDGHRLELYLVRLLFCLFADDTSIFEKGIFQDYITEKTREDGSDLDAHLDKLFVVLNTPPEERLKNLDESVAQFPYVNGKLFEERLDLASFDSKMRDLLLECSYLNWGKISPAIFGSMFQSVMNPIERRNLGAHYTSEKNILKLIKPLFLDELWAEYESCKGNKQALNKLQQKIANLRFLDPACGCGNFLVITYREIRKLEIEILKNVVDETRLVDVSTFISCDVDKFYGIEIEEFPAQIAQVAMWLMDHQMNMQFSAEFGEYFVRLPLKKSATIKNANSLMTDWASLLNEGEQYDYILGNPPFSGSKIMSQTQRDDVVRIFNNITGCGTLDFVTAWYAKAAEYMQAKNCQAAFVSTNSITQGEQVGILWKYLIEKFNVKINFAHKTFKWSNEARGNAAVYCVIIGFAERENGKKIIYEYDDIKGEPHEIIVSKINPYLVEADNVFICKRNKAICDVPKIVFGNMPNDSGYLLFTDEEKEEFLISEPNANRYFKRMVSAYEFLNNKKRWCLWLVGIEPNELKSLPKILERVKNVQEYRLKSTRESTRKLAQTPYLFGEIRQPSGKYILIPRVSSENRRYIPMGFFDDTIIVSDTCLSVNTSATIYHLGILQSKMHISWVKYVCGRLKSDFRYSNEIVYNNFPWPENPKEKQIKAIEMKAQNVLDARALYPESSLADLYDQLCMPTELVKAHNELDRAVDLVYRAQPFTSEAKRMEFLFELYEKYTAGMFAKEKKKKIAKNK